MIYDCFQFNNEFTLLEIRLHHHSAFVDKFVITECPWTYSGQKKDLNFKLVKNNQPFVKFQDKIIHRIYDTPPNGKSNWDYEHNQRNYLRTMDFEDEDLIIYADCDELIRDKSIIDYALSFDEIITLDMALYWYYLNCVIKPGSKFQPDYSMESCFNHRWRMAKIFRPKHLHITQNLYQLRQMFLWDIVNAIVIYDAGWHFSNLGDPDLIYKKLCSFSHSKELNQKYDLSPEKISQRKRQLKDPLGRDVSFIAVKPDLPPFIINNLKKYKKYILNYA